MALTQQEPRVALPPLVVPKASEGSRIVVDREKAALFGQELEERKSGGIFFDVVRDFAAADVELKKKQEERRKKAALFLASQTPQAESPSLRLTSVCTMLTHTENDPPKDEESQDGLCLSMLL